MHTFYSLPLLLLLTSCALANPMYRPTVGEGGNSHNARGPSRDGSSVLRNNAGKGSRSSTDSIHIPAPVLPPQGSPPLHVGGNGNGPSLPRRVVESATRSSSEVSIVPSRVPPSIPLQLRLQPQHGHAGKEYRLVFRPRALDHVSYTNIKKVFQFVKASQPQYLKLLVYSGTKYQRAFENLTELYEEMAEKLNTAIVANKEDTDTARKEYVKGLCKLAKAGVMVVYHELVYPPAEFGAFHEMKKGLKELKGGLWKGAQIVKNSLATNVQTLGNTLTMAETTLKEGVEEGVHKLGNVIEAVGTVAGEVVSVAGEVVSGVGNGLMHAKRQWWPIRYVEVEREDARRDEWRRQARERASTTIARSEDELRKMETVEKYSQL